MMSCSTMASMQSADLNSIFNTTAKSRRLGRKEIRPRYKRKVSRKLSHQLSVDNDILVCGQDLHERVKQENSLIKTCTYLGKSYVSSFKGEELLHWMVAHCWAAHVAEAMSICQLLLTHNVICNVSDTRNLMTFKKFAIYRFREDQDGVPVEPDSDNMDFTLDMLYRRLWSDWVIRSRVIGWWLYTNTLTGEEFLSWLTNTDICTNKEEARHYANQLILVNFLIRIHPERKDPEQKGAEEKTVGMTEEDDNTIYQINVCCNQSVDVTTKVFHTLAHAVRLCSVHSEECMFYGKSDVQENILLEQFEMEESSPPPSLQSEDSADTSLSSSEEAKRFLQSVCRAYYPKFTSAIEDTYFSYQSNPASLEGEDFSIPDEMFHSFQLSTFDQEDSIVIELEDGLDLQDLDGDGKSILNVPDDDISESDTTKVRSSTLDLLPTPRDPSLQFHTARLEINFEDIPSH